MAICENCFNRELCSSISLNKIGVHIIPQDECCNFKDRSRFVELPCKIGTELFRIKQINGKRFITNTALNSNTFWNIVIQGAFGKTVFLTREEAEQALKERESGA